MPKLLRRLVASALTAALLPLASPAHAQIAWPATQLLPSFPAPASVQDLIELHGAPQSWKANDPALGHKTGRLDSDGGWLCQVGIDAPNLDMSYGPYVTTLPAGGNTAQYALMIDNNTADNNPVVTIDVNDATSGQVLASQVITRTQFTVAAQYTTFSLPFTIPNDNDSIELRVFWDGAAYTKVQSVGVTRSQADDELVLFASLKGIVNTTQPRIFSYEGDAFAEGPTTWLTSLGLQYTEVSDDWSLIAKYQSEIGGIIVYDNAQPDTINLATTLAGPKKALLVAPSLVARLTAAPYDFPILVDLRGKFTDKLSVYQSLYTDYWPSLTHRLAFGLDPINVRASVREYATAMGAAALWLDPTVPAEQTLLDQFLSSMDAGSAWMGWWPSEGPGVTEASKYGIATVASDYSSNLTLHSGMPRAINVPPIPAKPTLQNKIFVGFILSDGDNLQYVEHLERKLWSDAGRGKVPMGWTMSPAMVDAMPGALAYYWSTATPNDAILSGPSGYGYTYPNLWTNAAQLDQFTARSEKYLEQAGFRMITVWNTITGGINPNVGASYATNATSLLGVTAQNTGGALSIYDNTLPGLPLSCNYCTGEQAMKDFIATASQGWDGNEPRFVMIQAQPWQNVTPTSFMNVASSLDATHVVVRPDHLFELLRESNGLPINPVHTYTLTASADANGSITPSGAVAVSQNQNQAFTFTPAPGYSVNQILVDGTNVGSAPYTFINVTANHTIQVSFTNGTTPDGGTPDAGDEEDAGVPLTGNPDASIGSTDDGGNAAGGGSGGGAGSGCSCRSSREPTTTPALFGLVGLLALVRRRRAARSTRA